MLRTLTPHIRSLYRSPVTLAALPLCSTSAPKVHKLASAHTAAPITTKARTALPPAPCLSGATSENNPDKCLDALDHQLPLTVPRTCDCRACYCPFCWKPVISLIMDGECAWQLTTHWGQCLTLTLYTQPRFGNQLMLSPQRLHYENANAGRSVPDFVVSRF